LKGCCSCPSAMNPVPSPLTLLWRDNLRHMIELSVGMLAPTSAAPVSPVWQGEKLRRSMDALEAA
jgi:hypothetical protein